MCFACNFVNKLDQRGLPLSQEPGFIISVAKQRLPIWTTIALGSCFPGRHKGRVTRFTYFHGLVDHLGVQKETTKDAETPV